MNTQYEKNSFYLAGANYRMKRKKDKLRTQLVMFFTLLSGVCALLYTVISSLPY